MSTKYYALVLVVTVSVLLGSDFLYAEPGDTDTSLAKRVKTVLLFHSNVNPINTEVFVKNGIVTLKGYADSLAQKDLTEVYVDDVRGVKDVVNEMTVKGGPPKFDKTIYDIIDDASITSQIKTALIFHESTSILRTNVDTRDGVVTLRGVAKNAAEKDLVAKFASDINGVKKVINNITIE